MTNNKEILNHPGPVAIYNMDFQEPVGRDCDCACQEVCHPTTNKAVQPIDYRLKYKYNDFISEPINDRFSAAITQNTNTFGVFNKPVMDVIHAFKEGRTFQEIPSELRNEIGDNYLRELFDGLVHNYVLLPEPYFKPEVKQTFSSIAAWLHVTNQCNLNCSYCYLKRDKKKMSPEVGARIVQSLFQTAQRNNCKNVKVKYAGGEPLLNFSLIQELHQLAQAFSERTEISLEEVVLSNGIFLKSNKIEYLKENGLDLMISLDGIEEFNDIHRHDFKNSGAFKATMTNIEKAISQGLSPQISITVSPVNAKGLPQLVKWILEKGLRFNINFYRISKHSELSHQFNSEGLSDALLDTFEVIRQQFPLNDSLLSIIDRANLSFPHFHACGVGLNYLVFDCDGNLASCHMEIDKPLSNPPHSRDLLSIIKSRMVIQNPSVDQLEDCRSCKWKYWCSGGCPLNTYNVEGKYEVKSPYCEVYKRVFPELVKLEGARMIKSAEA